MSKPRWRWVRVDMDPSRSPTWLSPPSHLLLQRTHFMEANVPYRGWDSNEQALFTPRVADVVTVWNDAIRRGADVFGGITRVQFIDEYLKPAYGVDRAEYEAAAKAKR